MSKVDGETRSLPAEVAVVHLFNQGTHHRGQLTTLMKQAEVDPGELTCLGCPGTARIDG